MIMNSDSARRSYSNKNEDDAMASKRDRTLYVRNLDPQVNEELLYELFLQAGPLVDVFIPRNAGETRGYAFIEYEDEEAVLYAIDLFRGTCLFGRELSLAPRDGSKFRDSINHDRNRMRSEHSREFERQNDPDRQRFERQFTPQRPAQYNAAALQTAHYGLPFQSPFQSPLPPANWQPSPQLPTFINTAFVNNPHLAFQQMLMPFGLPQPQAYMFANTQRP